MVWFDGHRRKGPATFELEKVSEWYESWMNYMMLAEHKIILLGHKFMSDCFEFVEVKP
jgi:hypothetical protein